MLLRIVKEPYPARSTCWKIEFWHVYPAEQINHVLTDLNESTDPEHRRAVEAFIAELDYIAEHRDGVHWNADTSEAGKTEGLWPSSGGVVAAWFLPRDIPRLVVFTHAAYGPDRKREDAMKKDSLEILKIHLAGDPSGGNPVPTHP